MSVSGTFLITTPEPLRLEMSPREDFYLVFADVQDDADETPIPHTSEGILVMEVVDSEGDIVLSMASGPATAFDGQPMLPLIVLRAGTTNVFDIRIPWDVVSSMPPGQYTADLVERKYADQAREVLTSFILFRAPS